METDLIIGTWNIKTINGKEEELVEEMRKYKTEILGLSETKRRGNGEKTLKNNYILRYSGISTGRAKKGVGIIVSEYIDKFVVD